MACAPEPAGPGARRLQRLGLRPPPAAAETINEVGSGAFLLGRCRVKRTMPAVERERARGWRRGSRTLAQLGTLVGFATSVVAVFAALTSFAVVTRRDASHAHDHN